MARLEDEDLKKKQAYFIAQIEEGKKMIFVEGSSDFNVIKDFYMKKGIKGCSIIQADWIINDNDDMIAKGYKDGNRNRIKYLCEILSEIPNLEDNYLGIIDRDFDKLDGVQCDIPKIEYTDYANMEMFFYDRNNINRVINIEGLKVKDPTNTLNHMEEILKESFFIRAFKREINNKGAQFEKNIKWKSSIQKFHWNKEEYIKKYFGHKKEEYEKALRYVEEKK